MASKNSQKNSTDNDPTETEISSIGAEPIENSNIPADTNDGDDFAKLDFSSKYSDPFNLGARFYTGTEGADTFEAEALLNAKPEILAKHTDGNGNTDWRAVAGENDNRHDHWVEGPGEITIDNFGEGDKFILTGHTAEAILVEESDNQAVIGLVSDQGDDKQRGNGAHDLDVLGKVTINHDGNFDFGPDVKDNENVFDGIDPALVQKRIAQDSSDNAEEGAGDGGNMDQNLEDAEDTTVEISSIGAEPIENPDIPADTNDGNDIEKLDFSSQYTDPDGVGVRTFTGTDGANTFQAQALLNAKPEIIAKHTDSDGRIDWQDVAGENNNYHDHWVEGPGEIVIQNFGEGDKFILRGHTSEAILLEESDGIATIGLVSDQGRDNSRGNGAHDLDILGKATIHHDGSFNFQQDVTDITNNVFDGVMEFA